MQKELKLRTELIPTTAFHKNLRTEVPRRVWNKIRTDVCAYQGLTRTEQGHDRIGFQAVAQSFQ